MLSEWPIRADARTPAPRADCAFARPGAPADRVVAVAADLFVPAAHRMSDRVRAYVSTMLDSVVGGFERDLRKAVAPRFAGRSELAAALTSPAVGIAVPLLHDARTLAYPPLVRILLRRAAEFVLSRRREPEPGPGPLADDADPGVAEVAMALAIADARRVDRFGAPALLADDLPAEVAHWLVWQAAAALRHYLRAHHAIEAAEADDALTAAAADRLAAHDEGAGLRPLASRLASMLSAAGRTDGPLLRALLDAGQPGTFTALLAAAAGLPAAETWNVIADPADGRLALVLRAADLDRPSAAGILLGLTPDPAAEIDLFDACDRATALRAIAELALPPAYRDAKMALDAALVGRGSGG